MMEYYSAILKNDKLLHDRTWTSHENFMLSKRSQSKKITYLMILIYELYIKGKCINTESRLVVPRAGVGGTERVGSNLDIEFLWSDENALKLGHG